MNSKTLFSLMLLLAMSASSCAKDNTPVATAVPQAQLQKTVANNNSTLQSRIIDKQALLVSDSRHNDLASLFSTSPVSADIMAEWIIKVLKDQGAEQSFIKKLGPRIKMNPRLQKDHFVLPIIDEQGTEHSFELISEHDLSFYTLNYQKKTQEAE